LNNEKQAMKLLIEEKHKQLDVQKSLVEIEVQTQNVYQVFKIRCFYLRMLYEIYFNLGKDN